MTRWLFLIFLCWLPAAKSLGQLDKRALAQLAGDTATPASLYYARAGNNHDWMEAHRQNVVAKYNPVSLTFRGLMYLYQNVITVQLSKECPYYYTCSNYAKKAIHECGLLKGVLLAGDRLMRCNRISLLDVSTLYVDETTHTILDEPSMY
jgi:putative component of membrane protein insertase Oxa1/YidC/SpoIIIJ protein YidD